MWELDYKESGAPKNWGFWTMVLEKTLESPLDCKEIQSVHPKGNQSWILLEGLMLKLELQYVGHLMRRADSFERPWCWVSLRAGGEGDNRGWDGWMASPTQWTWVWMNSGSWWWTGSPGMLHGFAKVRHNWATELNWTDLNWTDLNWKSDQKLSTLLRSVLVLGHYLTWKFFNKAFQVFL